MTIALWLMLSYVALPAAWRWTVGRHPALEEVPHITHTGDGIPGDPLNLAVVGSEADVIVAMTAAGWRAADPITARSSLRIATGTVLRRPYEDAPVSNLYVWGRKQDLAFEQPVGRDPRQRHHVRFWCSETVDDAGRPLWIGAATFDTQVGFSHRTGQVTHHIGADVDKERDKLLHDLLRAGKVENLDWVEAFQSRRTGRNGGGDSYYTDGRLPVAALAVWCGNTE